MLTQEKIKTWCSLAIAIFKNYMPEVDEVPQIHIVTDKILAKRRAEIAERIKAPQRDIEIMTYEPVMEMIHGECGDAILIRQHSVNDLLKDSEEAFHDFLVMFWHEMGHFYAIKQEKTDLHRFMDADLDENDIDGVTKQEGYWFWSEFVAQCIAFHVDFLHCSIDNKENYHPEKIEWNFMTEMYVSNRLIAFLDSAVDGMLYSVDTGALAMYFATLFKDDITQRYLKAPEQGILLSTDNWLELTMISHMMPEIQEKLVEMYELIKKQMEKERFWETDEQFLYDAGELILDIGAEND